MVDGLGLEFSEAEATLNRLDNSEPDMWAAGKFFAYLEQNEPFVHLDYDVFLFKPLPLYFENAQVFAQSEEPFLNWSEYSPYRPQVIEALIDGTPSAWLPKEWRWYSANKDGNKKGICCGIFGGANLKFIHYYAETALRFLELPQNRRAMLVSPERKWIIMHVEQYYLAALLDYYQMENQTKFMGLNMRYLLDYRKLDEDAQNKGYVHLIGKAKESPTVIEKLERRVREHYPVRFERLEQFLLRGLDTTGDRQII